MNNSKSESNKIKLLVNICILTMCLLVGFIIYQIDNSFVHNSLAETSNYPVNNDSEQIIDLETSTNSVNLIVQNNVIVSFQPLANFNGNLVISADIIEIGYRAFAGDTSIKSISFESGSQLEAIGDYAFANCVNLKSIDKIPKKVMRIGDGAFLSCERLTSITFEENSWLDIIGVGAFSNCVELQTVDFGTNRWLDTIGAGAFSDCHKLSKIVIPYSVTNIGDGAFLWCSNLTFVSFGKSTQLKRIGMGAFSNCSNLTSVTIPSNVSEIGYGAFSFCDNLTIYTQLSSRPSTWDINWNSADYENMERPVIWGCTLETDKSYVISFNKTNSNIYNPKLFEIMAPNREDYRFDGWYSTPSFSGISYTASQISSAPNGIYYAKWFLTTYNITYRDAGDKPFSGIHGINYPTKHFYGYDTILQTPTKVGYKFEGWYLNSNGFGSRISTLSATGYTSDITLYAQWIPKTYSIIYRDFGGNPFSGMFINDDLGFPHPTTHTYGIETKLINPVKKGYIFEGWFLNSWCVGEPINSLSATGYTSNITLYAKWETATYNIIYRDLGNKPFSGSFVFIVGGYPTMHTYGIETKLVNPYRTGYTFGGWFLNNSGTGTAITVIPADALFLSDIILYAKWIPETYNITYQDVGNKPFSGMHGVEYPTTHTYGKETKLVNPSKSGYIFDGWFLNSSGEGTPLTSLSATGYTSNIVLYAKWSENGTPGLSYTLINNGTAYEVSKGTANTNGEVSIPESYNGLPVTKIQDRAFRNCTGLITVNIPSSIELIGYEAFEYCKNLENVFFETNSALTLIDAWAFNGCKLTNITLPNNLTTIERFAFYNSKLTGIVIPSSVTIIKDYAFYYCKDLLSVTFASNSNLIDIGSYAFSSCSELSNISIPSSVNSIGSDAFYYCENLLSVTFASNSNLIDIGSYAFSSCSELSNINIPSSVNSIGSYAFYNCKDLLNVTFASNASLTNIGSYAFSYCDNLTNIQIPASVTDIGINPFANCNRLNTVSVASNNAIYKSESNCIIRRNDNVLIIGCNTSVIPTDVTSIGYGAFQGCNILTSITIPNNVISIEAFAFSNCSSLTNISISNSVTSIGRSAFSSCRGLTTITIPGNVSEIGSYAFSYCSMLKDIIISNGVERIGDGAFQNCENLSTITIPASVISIGDLVFLGCDGLNAINVDASNNNYSSIDGVLYNKAQTILLCYPSCKTGSIVMASGVSEIGSHAFSGCNITDIVIPASVTTIKDKAFSNCYELNSIIFETGSLLTEIGDGAFEYCNSLLSIIIPAGVTNLNSGLFCGCESLAFVIFEENSTLENIGSSVFDSCYNLKAIAIPLSVQSIQSNAFNFCTGIDEITIPSTVTYMESNIFEGWTAEQTIYINADYSILGYWDVNWAGNCEARIVWSSPNGYTEGLYYNLIQDNDGNYAYEVSVGNSLDEGNGVVIIPDRYEDLPVIGIADYGFYNCTELIKVIFVPGSLAFIGENAFSGCYNLVNINIPTTVTEIRDYAFYECHSIKNINIPASVTQIGYYSFAECYSLRSITIPSAVILIDYSAMDGTYGYTIYAEADYEPSEWHFLWSASDYSIFWGCTLSIDKSYVVSIMISDDNIINTDPLYPPYREEHIFLGWSTSTNGLPQYTMQDILDGRIPTSIILYAVWMPI